jgi:hypothetical protein
MILARLRALSGDMGSRAARAVDGVWWNSRAPLRAKGLVTCRKPEIGALVSPWLVQQAPVNNDDKATVALCGEPNGIPLRDPNTCVTGRTFEDYAEIEVDEALAAGGFPFPQPYSRTITRRDFAYILDEIRKQNAAQFGPQADRPD